MKKGFTLIELLAVIVILAIIAVIAVPIVLNIIEETKNNANLRSIDFYLDAIEKSIATKIIDGESITDGSYDINNGSLCIDLECNDLAIIEMNGKVPEDGWIVIKNGKIEWYDFVIDGKNYPMTPYSDDSCFSYFSTNSDSVSHDFNEYFEIVDINACLELVGEGMESLCASAHDIMTANLSGDDWFLGYVEPRGIVKQIKEFPKDVIYGVSCDNQDIIIPSGVKEVKAVIMWPQVNKVIIPNTVEKFDVYGSYMNDVIIPNSVKEFGAGWNRLETLNIPSSVTKILHLSPAENLTRITIKNSKENLSLDDIGWKQDSECSKWTGDIKDNPCIQWVK